MVRDGEQESADQSGESQSIDTGYIYTTVNVRAGPTTETKVVDQLQRGDSVEFVNTDKDWVRLVSDGNTGRYVYKPLVKSGPVPVPAPPQAQCHGLIEDVLTSPASADFPFLANSQTLSDGPAYYAFRISGEVDAENAFGATLRKEYSCILWTKDNSRSDTINWNVSRVVLGGQVLAENAPFPWE